MIAEELGLRRSKCEKKNQWIVANKPDELSEQR